MSKARVLLADDHAVLRAGLALLLNGQDDFIVVGEASSGLAALALAEELQPDLILLDLSMAGLNGLASIPVLRLKAPDSRILVLTMHDDPEYLRQALKSGAAGYILKKAADTELLSAMRIVVQGDVYVHPSLNKHLLVDILPKDGSQTEVDHWDSLSPREQEVLRYVAFGHTSAEIAEMIGVSPKTVETYRARGMEKLNLKTRAALVRMALERGLLDT